jgi:RNA polymerase primary sigma factor
MANKTKATPQKEEAREEGPETPDAPLPLLDLSDAAVTKMIKQAKKRGYVIHQQLNAVIPSEEVTSEQIEHILAMLNEMGINVVETEEAEAEEEEPREEAESEETESGELVEVAPKTPAKSEAKEPIERTDDPVRMYLREMGSIGLISRQGEVAIAKRIEAGREAMIAGLCESPLKPSSSGATN